MKRQILTLALAMSLCAAMTAGAFAAPANVLETRIDYSVMLKEDGSLWAVAGDEMTPVKVLENVASVSAGSEYTLAVKQDSSLWSWNQVGGVPVKVMDGVASAYAGFGSSVVLKTDGTLWSWSGKAGAAKLMEGVKAVSLGGKQAIALKNDGTLWNWGPMVCLANGHLWYDWTRTPQRMRDVYVPEVDQVRAQEIRTDGSLWGVRVEYVWH